MRKQITITCATLVFVTFGSGQQTYSLTPDTKKNSIELTIVNESPNTIAENVEIRVSRHSSYVMFPIGVQRISSMLPKKEIAVPFTFDISRSAPTNKRDTIEFSISDRHGLSWTKSIVVQYNGPAMFALDQNFPNPFNPSTMIYYQVPMDSRVTLKVFDILGREVMTLVNEDRPAGYHDVRWDAGNVGSGVYFYRMEAQSATGGNRFHQVKKLMVLK